MIVTFNSKPKETIDLEIDNDNSAYLQKIANSYNCTIGEIIERILKDSLSKEIEIDEFKNHVPNDIDKQRYIITKNGKAIAYTEPVV